ncbi:hypothetical protein BC941DRAFT_415704 [Chlamydoabsidia padenii]|nr:hypothetical protein BC941DRAFT_415704 [Chlamydoabsidia padenii]
MQMPMRSHSTQQDQQQQSYSTTSLNDNDQRSETENNNIGQQQTVLPIFIIGYRTIGSVDPPPSTTSNTTTSPTSYTSSLSPLPTYIPAGPHLRRRPRSAISTSSSLATLQSMPMSVQSNRTNHTSQTTLHIQHQHHHTQQQQPQQHHREFLLPSSSSTSSSTSSTTAGTTQGGRWLIYVMSGQHRPYPHDTVHHLGRLSDNPTYEDLLWLSSILGPAHPVTTTQQAIDATLSTFTWSDEITKRSMLQDHTDRCLVCLDDFMPKQTVRVLKCRHVFHVECVDRWLVEAHNSCPICRCVPVAQSNPSPTTTTTTTI